MIRDLSAVDIWHKNSTKIRAAFLTLGLIAAGSAVAAPVVNVYSYRQPQLVKNVTDEFTKDTGIVVRILYAKEGLIDRIKREGKNSPADLLLTKSFSRVFEATQKNIVEPVRDRVIEASIPENYRAADGSWFAITKRARIFYASRDRVSATDLSYEDIADNYWQGKVCTRSGQHPYNIGLFSWILVAKGEDYLRDYLQNLKNNLGRKPVGNDREQVKAIYSGRCDISIGNNYYLGLMITNETQPEQKKWAASVKPIIPTLGYHGTHENISGMQLIKNAPNKRNALRLMRWLTTKRAQEIYSDANFEYPVRKDARISRLVKSWGMPKTSDISFMDVAKNISLASEIVESVGFDN